MISDSDHENQQKESH